MPDIPTHPVQTNYVARIGGKKCRVPQTVTLAAYEVYSALYGPQEALIDDEGRGCRGGFDVLSELVPFLYARAFPREEWRKRVDEATNGMVLRPDDG